MQAGGFTETIWHFIGSLQIHDSVARMPVFYNGDPPALPQAEVELTGREPLRGLAFDELVSVPSPWREQPLPEPFPVSLHLGASSLMAVSSRVQAGQPPLKPPSHVSDAAAMSLPAAHAVREIAVTYRDATGEGLFQIKQVNLADDRDLATSDAVRNLDGSPVVLPELRLDGAFGALMRQADAIAPDGIPDMGSALKLGTDDVVAMVATRNALWAATGSPHPDGTAAGEVPVGRVVDGEAGAPMPSTPGLLESAPWRPEGPALPSEGGGTHTVTGPTGGAATFVEAGLNQQINAAAIVDLNEGVGSMIVAGDYFYSRGIVQANILVDNDHVDIAVSGALDPIVRTQGNAVHNIAEFVTHESTMDVRGAASNSRWVVDVMRGDFYDVKSIVQFNGLDDSDRTVQAGNGLYLDLATGQNQQLNLTKIFSIADYDIIVIGGNYHRADWIYQYNIVLDPDTAGIFATGGDASSTTVTTGFNSLTNKATITTYDAESFKPMGDAHKALLGQLDAGATVLLPNADWHLYGGNGGPLKVLYVSGDYYDANVVTQVNFLIDGDQAIQASGHAGTAQGVAAGGNSALNEAVIVDPGLLSSSNYLGGQAYEEALLIQVNIVTDSDTVTIHDTSRLVPELVAFAHETEAPSVPVCQPFQVPDPAHHDHLTSNILA